MEQNVTTITDLNDDCLLEIFQYLNVHDAFSIIGCFDARIDNIAYAKIAVMKKLTITLKKPPPFTNWQLEIIGRNLKFVEIKANNSISDLILTYLEAICSQGSLETLTLNCIQFDDHYQNCLLNVARYLKVLNLNSCKLTDELLSPILEKCTNLKSLSLLKNPPLKFQSLYALNSKYLNELIIEQYGPSNCAIESFVAENPNVVVKVYVRNIICSGYCCENV